jgi:hypothetical protein
MKDNNQLYTSFVIDVSRLQRYPGTSECNDLIKRSGLYRADFNFQQAYAREEAPLAKQTLIRFAMVDKVLALFAEGLVSAGEVSYVTNHAYALAVAMFYVWDSKRSITPECADSLVAVYVKASRFEGV